MGSRESKVFPTKREAEAWAAQRETFLRGEAKKSPAERHTLGEVLEKYSEEIASGMRGARWAQIRLAKLLRDPNLPCQKFLSDIQPEDFIAWRDSRLRQVSSGSVLRELGLLNTSIEWARKELRWITKNPLNDVSRPKPPKHREVIISPFQIRRMLVSLGYSPTGKILEVRQVVAVCFLLALRTGMRAGELCGLPWDQVRKDTCMLPVTKTNAREVSLSIKALRIINKMRGWDERFVFGLKTSTLDAMFRKYRERAGLDGFVFHDSRHTAATMLARKLDILDLCKMFGWTDPKMAMIYYNPTASDIARRINSPSLVSKQHQSR